MELLIVVICVLGLIVAAFLYIFLFRMPSSGVQAARLARLDALCAEPDVECSTLMLYAREPEQGQLEAVALWLDSLEQLDPVRQVLPGDFEHYASFGGVRVRWRERWQAGPYAEIQQASHIALSEQLEALREQGWRVEVELPFSPVDHLYYLVRLQS